MGSGDIVKYVVTGRGILKPIIAKWEYTPPITTPHKATLSFSYTVSMSKDNIQPILETTCIERPPLCCSNFTF